MRRATIRDLDRLVAIIGAALPGEGFLDDDLAAIAFEHEAPVVAVVDEADRAAGIATVTKAAGALTAHVQVVAVRPEARRRRLGTDVLRHLERWAFADVGAASVSAGGGTPFRLFDGVDVAAMPALCFFERNGYQPSETSLHLSFPSGFRSPLPDGCAAERVLTDEQVAAARAWAAERWPERLPEVVRAIEHGTCHAVVDAGDGIIAMGSHSVSRLGWLGPIGVDARHRSRGAGSALLGLVAKDLMAAGLDVVEVPHGEPFGFYSRAGASVSRVFRRSTLEQEEWRRRSS